MDTANWVISPTRVAVLHGRGVFFEVYLEGCVTAKLSAAIRTLKSSIFVHPSK